MLRMCPPIGDHLQVGEEGEQDRKTLLRKAAVMEANTFWVKSFQEWTDEQSHEARAFIDEHGLRVGETAPFYLGKHLGSPDPALHREALEQFRTQLRIARTLGAHCVGFGWGKEFTSPNPAIWAEDTWRERIDGVADLIELAEEAEMDVAGHPLYFSPLNSVERYQELLQAVASPRLKVLMDIVNITLPHMAFNTTDHVERIFDALGEHIVAIHAKDVKIAGGGLQRVPKTEKGLALIHVDEVVPGTGILDYATVLRRLGELDQDVTIHVEHFQYEDTIAGQQYIRSVARDVGVELN